LTSKLPFFPTPYKDELLYSVFARYHKWSRNSSSFNTNMALFGSRNIIAKTGFPNGLEELTKKLPPGQDEKVRGFIDNNTLYPLFHPFLQKEQGEKIIEEMYKKNGKASSLAGVIQSKIPLPRYLRFCQKCQVEDEWKHGEAYWHRTHQVFGANVCPWHKEFLVESEVETSYLKIGNYIALCSNDKRSETKKSQFEEEHYDRYLELSTLVYELLNTKYSVLGYEQLYMRYMFLLKKMKLATFTGVIKEQKLLEQFVGFYGEQFLCEVHSSVNINTRNNWVNLMTKPKSKVHPIRHLLFINFLGLSLQEFFSFNIDEEKPFGSGPWICYNAASNHYLKAVIKNVKIKRGTGTRLPVGTFSCSCGFTYSKAYCEEGNRDDSKIGRILSYGADWEEKLLRLKQEEKKTIREIASELNVTPLTVIRKLKKLKNEDVKLDVNPICKKKLLVKHRDIWINLLKMYPEKKRTELRMMAKSSYIWLYRHDKKWLDSNSPIIDRTFMFRNHVDWRNRDNEYFPKIEWAVKKIKNSEGRPKRITCSSIGKELGIYPILLYGLAKMPKTKEAIEKAQESIEEFQIRRVQWSAEKLYQENDSITPSKIRKNASIPLTNISPKVLEKVNYEANKNY
jgi:DNA-binding Lrp family transcriptional regulator